MITDGKIEIAAMSTHDAVHLWMFIQSRSFKDKDTAELLRVLTERLTKDAKEFAAPEIRDAEFSYRQKNKPLPEIGDAVMCDGMEYVIAGVGFRYQDGKGVEFVASLAAMAHGKET